MTVPIIICGIFAVLIFVLYVSLRETEKKLALAEKNLDAFYSILKIITILEYADNTDCVTYKALKTEMTKMANELLQKEQFKSGEK